MTRIDEYSILKKAICSLRETSIDNHDGNADYMSESILPVVNFDTVKDRYISGLSVPEAPASNDALYVDDQGEMFFIEFKAGSIEGKKVYDLRLKLFDSLLILTDIIGEGVSFTREYLNYILVYDETKNPVREGETIYQATPSRELLSSHYIRKGGNEFIRFKLLRFQRLYVKRMFTVNKDDFEERLASKWATGTFC